MVDSLHRPIDSNPFIDLFILWLDSPIHLLTRFGPLLIDPREMQYPADSDGAWMVLGWCLDSITCMASDGAWMVLGWCLVLFNAILCYYMPLYATICYHHCFLSETRICQSLVGVDWCCLTLLEDSLGPSIQAFSLKSKHPIQASNPGIQSRHC